MLSDRERQELSELESQFQTEDPQFASSFDARTQRPRGRFITGFAVATMVPAAMVLALVLLVTGSVGGLLGLAAVAGMFWVIWLSIKHSRDAQDGPRP